MRLNGIRQRKPANTSSMPTTFLAIHPDTHALNKEDYDSLTATQAITDFHYKAQTLHATFADGSVYEYYSVPQKVYNKFVNNDGNLRFARRHILHSFTYRRIKKAAQG